MFLVIAMFCCMGCGRSVLRLSNHKGAIPTNDTLVSYCFGEGTTFTHFQIDYINLKYQYECQYGAFCYSEGDIIVRDSTIVLRPDTVGGRHRLSYLLIVRGDTIVKREENALIRDSTRYSICEDP